MQQKTKRRPLLLILLLLLIGFAVWFFFFRKVPVSQAKFIQQGSSTIKGNAEIKIWDYSAVDGDTIDFYFDGQLIFKNYGLEDTARIYKTGHLSKGDHWIGVKAVSEGSNPPATTHISINDGTATTEFDIDSWKDSSSGSWIIRVE